MVLIPAGSGSVSTKMRADYWLMLIGADTSRSPTCCPSGLLCRTDGFVFSGAGADDGRRRFPAPRPELRSSTESRGHRMPIGRTHDCHARQFQPSIDHAERLVDGQGSPIRRARAGTSTRSRTCSRTNRWSAVAPRTYNRSAEVPPRNWTGMRTTRAVGYLVINVNWNRSVVIEGGPTDGIAKEVELRENPLATGIENVFNGKSDAVA